MSRTFRYQHIPYGDGPEHSAALKRGLKVLGPDFVARVCFWCDGTTEKNFEHCYVCSKGLGYGLGTGLLIGSTPAPWSVVNQVLVAAERS